MDLNDKKIAVLGLKRIGDAVYTLPTFEVIKHVYPSAHITVFTEPQVTGIYEFNPFIDDVESYPKNDFWKASLSALKAGGFDVCIINHNALKYAFLAFLAGIPIRVGYQKEGRSIFLTHKRPLHKKKMHRLEHNALLLDLLSLESRNVLPKIYQDISEQVVADRLLDQFGLNTKQYIVFIVGSIAQTRRWFPENFAAVAKSIMQVMNIPVVILGGPDDFEIAEQVANLVGENQMFQNLAGKTSLRETILLFNSAKMVITNDTGPLHVASAIGVPVVTWFGAADENEIAPPSPNTTILNAYVACGPCVKEVCPEKTLKCLHEITPEMVLSTIDKKI